MYRNRLLIDIMVPYRDVYNYITKRKLYDILYDFSIDDSTGN